MICSRQRRSSGKLLASIKPWLGLGRIAIWAHCALLASAVSAEEPAAAARPVLNMIATAHLDTQWRWTVRETIADFLPNTLRSNFALFEKYPSYTFNFEGAYRYMLVKEYHPELYQRLRAYIESGRWSVSGPGLDSFDVNLPAPESLIRSMLYAQVFYREEFGITARDVFLPDCFGFNRSLPTLAMHCGMRGFSTQKLSWGCAADVPFRIGAWEGVDGSLLPSVFHAQPYISIVRKDLSQSGYWSESLLKQAELSGFGEGYHYFGVGDQGGAPDESSVAWLEGSARASNSVAVRMSSSSSFFERMNEARIAGLPRYRGDLLMSRHGTGGYTSLGVIKEWNRRNELLAGAAERAALVADWLGGMSYPSRTLQDAWIRFLWHQQHDGITGTSVDAANRISLNDEIVSRNQFCSVLESSAAAWIGAMDTVVEGMPVAVFNPLASARRDIVEVRLPSGDRACRRVYGPDGAEACSQMLRDGGGGRSLIFLADVPALGMAVYDIREAEEWCRMESDIKLSRESIENGRYRLAIDSNGNVASIWDKLDQREMLRAPIELQLLRNEPGKWPAWEIRYEDILAEPLARVGSPAKIRIIEEGPLRAKLRIERECMGSRYTQDISLEAFSGDLIVFENDMDWRTRAALLKAAFPSSLHSSNSVYNLGVGSARRGLNTERLYEVPSRRWAGIFDEGEEYGVAVLAPAKYGWDMPDAGVLRLSLIHAPAGVDQDIGRHRVRYALVGGSALTSLATDQRAARFEQDLIPFVCGKNPGLLGREFSFMQMDCERLGLLALKRSEDGGKVLLRVVGRDGAPRGPGSIGFAAPIIEAEELNGLEERVGPAKVVAGRLECDPGPHRIKTYALVLGESGARLPERSSESVDLPFDADVVARPGEMDGGVCGSTGEAYPADLLPESLSFEHVDYKLGSSARGLDNAVVASGQSIALPAGEYNRVNILAASTGGDVEGRFRLDGEPIDLLLQDFRGDLGRWDMAGIDEDGGIHVEPGWVKTDPVAWLGTHRIDQGGARVPYAYSYLFRYSLPCQAGASRLVLPDDERILVFAVSTVSDPAADTRFASDHWADCVFTAEGGRFLEGAWGFIIALLLLFGFGTLFLRSASRPRASST